MNDEMADKNLEQILKWREQEIKKYEKLISEIKESVGAVTIGTYSCGEGITKIDEIIKNTEI